MAYAEIVQLPLGGITLIEALPCLSVLRLAFQYKLVPTALAKLDDAPPPPPHRPPPLPIADSEEDELVIIYSRIPPVLAVMV